LYASLLCVCQYLVSASSVIERPAKVQLISSGAISLAAPAPSALGMASRLKHETAAREGGKGQKSAGTLSDQKEMKKKVIRENPASRGTETSAEVLVGPPLGAGGLSETPVNSSGTRLTLTLDGGLEGPPRPVMAPCPFPSASSVGVGRRRGSTWVRQFSPP
jgi:hypothetical protein